MWNENKVLVDVNIKRQRFMGIVRIYHSERGKNLSLGKFYYFKLIYYFQIYLYT